MPEIPSASRPRLRHIALAFPAGVAHLHEVTRGITDYATANGPWLFTTSPEQVALPIRGLRGWHGDGIIAVLTQQSEVTAAREIGLPVVNFSSAFHGTHVPRVTADNPAIGRLAAEHLIDCGFRRFAFYGLRNVDYSAQRGDAFVERIREGGFECSVNRSPSTFSERRPWQDEMENLGKWLKKLQPPVGLFAVTDQRARLITDACRGAGLRVPNDVGVIGVDNDLVACEFSDPPLTSVACDWYRVGHEAAALLDRLMAGAKPPRDSQRVPPTGVVQRQSTDITVVEDANVASAIEYIRDHLSEVFGVEALVKASGISRRNLEASFARAVGSSPYHYLCLMRVQRAKVLLGAPGRLKLSDIALQCGFADQRRFRLVFRRLQRITPAMYRRNHAGGVAASPMQWPPVRAETRRSRR